MLGRAADFFFFLISILFFSWLLLFRIRLSRCLSCLCLGKHLAVSLFVFLEVVVPAGVALLLPGIAQDASEPVWSC